MVTRYQRSSGGRCTSMWLLWYHWLYCNITLVNAVSQELFIHIHTANTTTNLFINLNRPLLNHIYLLTSQYRVNNAKQCTGLTIYLNTKG